MITDTSVRPPPLALVSVDDGQKRTLTSPSATSYGDFEPAFSPDGRWLAFLRTQGVGVTKLHIMPMKSDFSPEAEPKILLPEGQTVLTRPAWSADSRELVYSRSGELWHVGVLGTAEPARLVGTGNNVSWPSIARQGRRMVYVQSLYDSNVWRMALSADGKPERVIASSQREEQAEYSPDGRKIAFSSSRSGSWEIWVTDADGSRARQMTSFAVGSVTRPRWSPDGRNLALAARPTGNVDVYVVSTQGGSPRRLTTHTADDASAKWSRDGKWIYFASNRTGRHEVWKRQADGTGDDIQVTRNGGWVSEESVDGKILYYSKFDLAGIWKMPVAGGDEAQVLDRTPRANWDVKQEGIYYLNIPDRSAYLLEFSTGRSRRLATLKTLLTVPTAGFSVSPDRKWAIYANIDQSVADIMLAENFR